jgi:hypothetical protein
MSTLDPTAQQTLLQIAEIASKRQILKEKCRSIERSDFKCTMQGVERLRNYKRELDQIELALESAVKEWDAMIPPSTHSLP